MIEVKQPSFNKGTAVRELMQHAPFQGRRPIFIGDDVTDEAAFDVCRSSAASASRSGARCRASPACSRRRPTCRWIAEMVRPEENVQ